MSHTLQIITTTSTATTMSRRRERARVHFNWRNSDIRDVRDVRDQQLGYHDDDHGNDDMSRRSTHTNGASKV